MSDMKCPICGEMLQKYGEVDTDTGTCIVLGANCPKCGIGDSDIKLWQEFIRTRKALDVAVGQLKKTHDYIEDFRYQETNYFLVDSKDVSIILDETNEALEQITALEQKEEK